MKKKIFSIITALALCLPLLPGTALAANSETRQKRTQSLVLTNSNQESAAEGWSWKQTDGDGYYYTLTLDNVDFEVENGNAIEFRMEKSIWLGEITIELKGSNRVASAKGYGIYNHYSYKALPTLTITGDGSLDVEGSWSGISISDMDTLKIKDTTVNVHSLLEKDSNQNYAIKLDNYGVLSLENSMVSANRIKAHTLTSSNSQLTATAEGSNYATDVIQTNFLTLSGGKLTAIGPEEPGRFSCGVSCDPNGGVITLSDCELDIRSLEEGIQVEAGKLSLQNVTGTVITTRSAANNSIYQNNAFDGLTMDPDSCKNCHIFAQTGDDVIHTFLYGDYTLSENATWSSTGLHIQEGCTFTVAEGAALIFTKDMTIHGNYENSYANFVNNGTVEFEKTPVQIWANFTNNGTLLATGPLKCDSERFTNNGTFDNSIGDTAQQLYGEQELAYDKELGKPTPEHRWAYEIHVTDGAVLTIPSGKTLDASQSDRGITNETLEEYLTVAETGKIVVEEGGELLLPEGITQEQLNSLHLSGAGTVKIDGKTTYRITFKDGDTDIAVRFIVPDGKAVLPDDPEKDGYTFGGWYTDAECTTAFEPSEEVESDLTVYAKWTKKTSPATPSEPDDEPAWENPFTDVKKNDWYYAAVEFANENGLFHGTSQAAFSPKADMTRGMLATVLYRLAKEPETTANDLFSDVAEGRYYTEAVAWAAENDIVAGYGNGKYGPEDSITREQLATILWRYAQKDGGGTIQNGTEILRFSDTGDVSDWAKEAMTWAVDKEIIQGKGNGILDPRGKASRAEVAAMLMRYCEAEQ